MKKIFIGIVLLSSISISAQSRWGIRTGLNYNLSTIGLSDATNSAQQILEGETADNGYHLGVFGRQFLGDQLYTSGSLIRLLKLVRAEAGVHYQGTVSDNAYNQTFQSPSVGYNVGVGLDLWKLSLDVTYYSSFQDHTGDWNNIPLSYNRSQLLVSLGVQL